MGCDAPIGWVIQQEEQRKAERATGYTFSSAVGIAACLRCGSAVSNKAKHDEWHDALGDRR